ncbi:legumain [Salvia divinorum]|uniref:Legumain n=1 Tax=Salvia divinorum TaxID=28513 RepID=A0ABD1FQW6_SALDI
MKDFRPGLEEPFSEIMVEETPPSHGGVESINMSMSSFSYIKMPKLLKALKKKYVSQTYKSLIFYLESCHSGSLFTTYLPPKIFPILLALMLTLNVQPA